ncbi:MAG: L,D-transpeptidase, partial [Patescibacteria group bacterium]
DRWELIIGTDIKNPDSDSDGFSDWDEVYTGYNPKSSEKQRLAKIIEVDLKQQILRYTFDGKILDQFHISSGIAGKRTPKGEFAILDKVPVKTYGGKGYDYYYPGTKWNLHFTTGYARYFIHGAYWHHNFGHPMSHGCVNVAYHNMENLYAWASVGTRVLIY